MLFLGLSATTPTTERKSYTPMKEKRNKIIQKFCEMVKL